MFKCELIMPLKLRDRAANGSFRRTVELPFVPFKGLEIDRVSSTNEAFEVWLVVYDFQDQVFRCFFDAPPDVPRDDENLLTHKEASRWLGTEWVWKFQAPLGPGVN